MASQFPQGRTAFVVIHGIGEQCPLETLDSFSHGLTDHFTEHGIPLNLEHKIAERGGSGGTPWVESYVHLKPPTPSQNFIDIHEFYWADLTEEKITVGEVWKWVENTLQATKRFYSENEELRARYEVGGRPMKYRLSKLHWYLYLISLVYPLLKFLIPLLDRVTFLPFLQKGAKVLENWIRPVIVGYIGDIAVYTTSDRKSKFFDVRARILAESQALVEEILKDHAYDRVFIAGHSLGSVIAYDTLNRLNLKANLAASPHLEKILGLITFGSPLDKIAFLFREHCGKDQVIRRQILQQLHSFKAKQLSFDRNSLDLAATIDRKLDHIKWVNYFDTEDPISGHLDFYDIPDNDNKELKMGEPWGAAHVAYWKCRGMYAHIVETFLSLPFGTDTKGTSLQDQAGKAMPGELPLPLPVHAGVEAGGVSDSSS